MVYFCSLFQVEMVEMGDQGLLGQLGNQARLVSWLCWAFTILGDPWAVSRWGMVRRNVCLVYSILPQQTAHEIGSFFKAYVLFNPFATNHMSVYGTPFEKFWFLHIGFESGKPGLRTRVPWFFNQAWTRVKPWVKPWFYPSFLPRVNTVVCHPFVCRVNTSLSVSRRGTAVNICQMKAAREFAALMSGICGHAANNWSKRVFSRVGTWWGYQYNVWL